MAFIFQTVKSFDTYHSGHRPAPRLWAFSKTQRPVTGLFDWE
jgi:hypothetical protein